MQKIYDEQNVTICNKDWISNSTMLSHTELYIHFYFKILH